MDALPVTRHHLDVAGRGVHYLRRGSGPPVVLLHASPRSASALLPLMRLGPANVTMFAFDTPGCGDSEPLVPLPGRSAPLDAFGPDASARDGVALDAFAYGDALAATLTALGIDRAAVHGTHTGAAIATAFAVRHPERVAALVLDGLGVFSADECERLLPGYLPSFAPQVDGSHLTSLWSRLRDQQLFFPWHHRRTDTRLRRPLPTPAQLHAGALDLLRAGDAYRSPYVAAFRFQPQPWLARLPMPVFVGARADDVLRSHLARLGDLPAHVRTALLPADDAAWAQQLWDELRVGCATLRPAPEAAPAMLPADRIGSAIVGAAGSRIHLRGAAGGAGRPRVLLHDSPGGARQFDRLLLRSRGERPTLALDLPSHGDSDFCGRPADPLEVAAALDAALRAIGIDAADAEGIGAGARIASACARLRPGRYRAPPCPPPSAEAAAAAASIDPFTPRADGGHLQAAWLHARDAAILGPTWSRRADATHDFGDGVDLDAVHRQCVEALKEGPEAAAMRRAWYACRG